MHFTVSLLKFTDAAAIVSTQKSTNNFEAIKKKKKNPTREATKFPTNLRPKN